MITPNKELLDSYLITALIANSITVAVGDAVIINTSAPQSVTGAANTTGAILGTVRAILNGPSGGNTPLQKNSVTTASDNLTNAQIQVKILPSEVITTYIADLDAAAGTTTNSQYFGYFNLSASLNGTLHEASYSASAAKQFLSYGLVPGSTTQVTGIWAKAALG